MKQYEKKKLGERERKTSTNMDTETAKNLGTD